MIRALVMRFVFPVAIVAMAAGVLVAAITSGYFCGYSKAWDELQAAPPIIVLDEALLTEALQLCRVLSAEFPENTNYKNRLAALLQLQARHCGQKPATAKPEGQSK